MTELEIIFRDKCAKFQIIHSLCFSRIIILIENIDQKTSNQAKKSTETPYLLFSQYIS
jgi:hypothetical protein